MHPVCFPGRKSSLRNARTVRPCAKRRFRRTNSQRPRRDCGRPVWLGLWSDHRQLLRAVAIFFIIRGRRLPTASRPTGCDCPTAIDPSRPTSRHCRATFFIRVRIKQCTGFRLEGEYSVFKRKYQKSSACFNGHIRQITAVIHPYWIFNDSGVLVRSDTKLSGCNRHSRGIDPSTACGEKTSRLARISLECSGCHGHACMAMWQDSRENMPTTSVGMAPNTLRLSEMLSSPLGWFDGYLLW